MNQNSWVLLDFTKAELDVVRCRTNGMLPRQVAKHPGITLDAVYGRLHTVYRKANVHDGAELTRWAIETGLDLAVEPDTPENAQVPREPRKRGRQRIRLNRWPTPL